MLAPPAGWLALPPTGNPGSASGNLVLQLVSEVMASLLPLLEKHLGN